MTIKDRIKRFKGNNIIWIIFLVVVFYIFVSSLAGELIILPIWYLRDWSSAMKFILMYYTYTIGSVLVLVVYCLIFKKNRFILRSFLPAGMGKDEGPDKGGTAGADHPGAE